MQSRTKYYGDAIELFIDGSMTTFQMPAGIQTRLWHIFSNTEVAPYIGIQLPRATSLQNGHPKYYIVNDSGLPLNIQSPNEAGTAPGVVLAQLANGEIGIVSLADNSFPVGSWVVRRKPATIVTVFEPTKIASFGSEDAPGTGVHAYAPLADSWQVKASMPVGGFDVSAGSFQDGIFARTFWMSGNVFYEFGPSLGHVARTPPGGTVPSNRPLMGSKGKLLYIDPPAAVNIARIYSSVSDSWANGPFTLPTRMTEGSGAESVSVDDGLVYFLGGAPDTERSFTNYDLGIEVTTVERTPIGGGFFAAALARTPGNPYVFGGNPNTSGGVPETVATAQKYVPSFRAWQSIPGMPFPGRGQGACVARADPWKILLGMGVWNDGTASTPRLFQYSALTGDYTAKSTFAWGNSDRRENAWANLKI